MKALKFSEAQIAFVLSLCRPISLKSSIGISLSEDLQHRISLGDFFRGNLDGGFGAFLAPCLAEGLCAIGMVPGPPGERLASPRESQESKRGARPGQVDCRRLSWIVRRCGKSGRPV